MVSFTFHGFHEAFKFLNIFHSNFVNLLDVSFHLYAGEGVVLSHTVQPVQLLGVVETIRIYSKRKEIIYVISVFMKSVCLYPAPSCRNLL